MMEALQWCCRKVSTLSGNFATDLVCLEGEGSGKSGPCSECQWRRHGKEGKDIKNKKSQEQVCENQCTCPTRTQSGSRCWAIIVQKDWRILGQQKAGVARYDLSEGSKYWFIVQGWRRFCRQGFKGTLSMNKTLVLIWLQTTQVSFKP